jgi:HEAT repeat protein
VSVAVISLWVALGAVLVTAALTLSTRAIGALSAARRERYRNVVSEQLAAFAVGACTDPPAPPAGRLEQRVLNEELARLTANLKGESHELLAALFAHFGLVESVARDLRSRHPLTAIRAAELAGIMGAVECTPMLLDGLGRDPLVRLACARALAEIGAVEAMPPIVQALSAGGGATELGSILMSFGVPAEQLLRERLRTAGSPAERRAAAVTLGEMHAFGAIDDLLGALADADPDVRAAAAQALGQVGDPAACQALVEQLQRADCGAVRVAAAQSLGVLDDPAAAPALVRALSSDDWDVRDAAARSLAAFGERGLFEVASAVQTISPAGIAHFAGILDVSGQLGAVIEQAAAGDLTMDVLVRAASASGVRSRLRRLASSDFATAGRYAGSLLGPEPVPA